MPVPERQGRYPSVRDDVRHTIRLHKFQPSTTHFTDVRDIYRLYLEDTGQVDKDSPELEDKFRSALGRILRPPASAGEYAKSFALPTLTRWHSSLSIVSPDARQIDPKEETKKMKLAIGRRFREDARTSSKIADLRAERKEKAIRHAQNPPPEDPPQQVSFRYVDEFIALKCAEDLIRLKVRFIATWSHKCRRIVSSRDRLSNLHIFPCQLKTTLCPRCLPLGVSQRQGKSPTCFSPEMIFPLATLSMSDLSLSLSLAPPHSTANAIGLRHRSSLNP